MNSRIVSIIALLATAFGLAAGYQRPGLQTSDRDQGGEERALVWVSFRDKAGTSKTTEIDQRALRRRARLGRALTYGDLPVSPKYLEAVRCTGAEIRVVSPWLNAVSVSATREQAVRLAEIDGVEAVSPVAVFRRPGQDAIPSAPAEKGPALIDYGPSSDQVAMMKVDQLHKKGYSGSGVRVTIIDTGFDRWHQSLLRVRVVAERDFQRTLPGGLPDTVTSFQPEQDSLLSQTSHGTAMLSLIGAYQPGTLIGTAYNADFILAKTERQAGSDFYQEEDWWIAALQWAADSQGTDIVSSSLGYRYWSDSVACNYGYWQMDGATARCSRAADSAAARGVLIVNSIGNVGAGHDTSLVAPADAKGVLAVGGAWSSSGLWSSGAATGPAPDSIRILPPGRTDSAAIRRIKPDVSSSWQNYCASNYPGSDGRYDQYYYGAGTSGATALTAGLCALLLEAHPAWRGQPAGVAEALKFSGSLKTTVEAVYSAPESLNIALGAYPLYNPGFSGIANLHKYVTLDGATYDLYDAYRLGWGVPDGIKALYYETPQTYNDTIFPEEDQLLDPYPNPVRSDQGAVFLRFYLVRDSYGVIIRIYSLDGRLVRTLGLGSRPASYPVPLVVAGSQVPAIWDLKDDRGNPVPSGLYIAQLSTGWNQSSRKIVVIR